eukprot:3938920-Prymnesium_polylepis.1
MGELRDAVRKSPQTGKVRLHLPEGKRFRLGGEPLAIHHADVTLVSDGEGAEIDAGGLSRHFDVALGGMLHLEKIHLVNGGLEMSGGSVLVRHGGTLSAINTRISSSEVLTTSGTARGGSVAVEDHNGIYKMLWSNLGPRNNFKTLSLAPDKSKVAAGTYDGCLSIWSAQCN